MATNPQPILYPLISNYRWDWSSVTFAANGVPLPGLQSIDYEHELKAGEVYANGSPQKIGATRGQYKPSASLEILELEYQNFILALSAILGGTSGYMEARWDLQVAKQDGQGLLQGPLFIDVIRGSKINKTSAAYKNGEGALVKKVELDVFYILENGMSPVFLNPANPKFTVG